MAKRSRSRRSSFLCPRRSPASPILPPPPRAATIAVADFVVFDALWRVDEEQATWGSGGMGWGSVKMFVALKATLFGFGRNKRRSDTSRV